MQSKIQTLTQKLRPLRSSDGYFRDGIEALSLGLRHVQECDSIDMCHFDLPGEKMASVEFNGGVPFYSVKKAARFVGLTRYDDWFQVTASEIVQYLEGK